MAFASPDPCHVRAGGVTLIVSCLPVLVLGMVGGLAQLLLRADAHAAHDCISCGPDHED
jgi:hypothetical protein